MGCAHLQDGVFISDNNGLTYSKIYDCSLLPSPYHPAILNLSQAAADAGLTLNEGFLIKFQSFDNTNIPLDGFSFDDVCLQRLNQPELTVAPSVLTSIQAPNTQKQRPLTLDNNGGGALTWQLFEAGTTVRLQGPLFEETAVAPLDAPVQAARPELVELARDETSAAVVRTRQDLLYDQSDNLTALRGVNSQVYEAVNVDYDTQARFACSRHLLVLHSGRYGCNFRWPMVLV